MRPTVRLVFVSRLAPPADMSVGVAAIALAVGSACGVSTDLDPRLPVLLLAPALLSAAFVRRVASTRAATLIFAAVLGLAGAALGARARADALETPLRHTLNTQYGQFDLKSLGPEGRHEPVTARFVLDEDASPLGDVVLVRASAIGIRLDDAWQPLPGDGVRLTVAGNLSKRTLLEWRAGRTIVAPAILRRPPRFLNDEVPDFERGLALDGVSLLGTVKSALLVHVERRGLGMDEATASVRAHVRRVVAQRVGVGDPMAAAVMTAVLIGDRSGLPDDVRLRLQQAGVYHVIAISGGNIAILAGIGLGALALCGLRGRPAAAATLLIVVAYACVVTAGPSVWRATLMAVLALAARTLDLRTPARHAVALAAVVMVVARPLDVRDPGFVLTFGATLALVETAHRLSSAARAWNPSAANGRRPWFVRAMVTVSRGWILTSIAASIAVELVLMPASAHMFSRVTIAGIVLNLIAVPLMAVVQVAGLATVGTNSWSVVADGAALIGTWGARAILESARLVEVVPWLTWRVPPPGIGTMGVYYAGLVLALSARRRARWLGTALLAPAALAIMSGASISQLRFEDRHPSLRLTVFDVGQAESMLLEMPGAGPLLIDAGGVPFGTGVAIGSRVLAPAIWSRGIRAIDAFVLTHGDPDHVGGADALIDDFVPKQLWTGVDVPGHEPTRALASHARRLGLQLMSLRAGDVRSWGQGQVLVLHPPAPDWERPRVRNDDSVVLEVLYGDTALLLTGDISQEVERAIIPRLHYARHRILKVAHHGSRTSTSRELLEAWSPELAVISCGRGNPFGHPAREVIQRLEAAGVRVLRTDRAGQITIESDGHDVTAHTFVSKGHEAHEGR